DSRKRMWTPATLTDGSSTSYGFGWEISTVNGHKLIAHNGALNGFLTSMQRYTNDQITIIVMINQSDLAESQKIATGVARLYLPTLRPTIVAKAPASVRPDRALINTTAGYYEYGSNYMLLLTPTQNGLAGRLGGGSPDEYLPVVGGGFWQP